MGTTTSKPGPTPTAPPGSTTVLPPSTTVMPPTVTTTTAISPSTSSTIAPPAPLPNNSVLANILIIAGDETAAQQASSGLTAYGIPFTYLLVPREGAELPELESTNGNFGGILVASEVSYDFGQEGFRSALTADQWNQLYAYQVKYGVRMVQYDVWPDEKKFQARAEGGCCASGVEQLISLTDTSDFPSAGLKVDATMSTVGLWHTPAQITNTTTTKQIAKFAANDQFGESVAGVINTFDDGRQQMVFFISWATNWSATSNFLQHAWIAWVTRGLYPGYRRSYLSTQIDDMFLITDLYEPAGAQFRIRPEDMQSHVDWLPTLGAKLNPGSDYFIEIGHNGNGVIEYGQELSSEAYEICTPGMIDVNEPPQTPLEWKKPLGTGTDIWPESPTEFVWTDECISLDPLLNWFREPANMDTFAHISHTFTHYELNNATYSDTYNEMFVNRQFLDRVGFSAASRFTPDGLIPPAITGLHNGDALQAFVDNNLTHCMGDNSRPALVNQQSIHHPYVTNVETDGFAGYIVIPRWATRIYYNCDTPTCTTNEWIDISAGYGGFQDLLALERTETIRRLLQLDHAPYMFHQANLRQADLDETPINGVPAKLSIFQSWVETMVQELVRLVDWPILTLTQQKLAESFIARAARDACNYSAAWLSDNRQITGILISAAGNTCSSPIPVTLPTEPAADSGFPTEKFGSDPLVAWVSLSGSPVTIELATPIPW
ncbi:hypothetical protein AJ79_05629 [Helicocarpus griseus UAMH5409]|uniref:Extracellular serine-rich protein n=1 Tax=Helicocarpus griseus UAMH5409 TaxID=1447875 RepID=A0A2B7XLJ0_9EURO|nr:hypothetical protein AJ79_05629 [Helicocarpus griseus UAMH5409]